MAKQATFKKPRGFTSSTGGFSKPKGAISVKKSAEKKPVTTADLLAQNEKNAKRITDSGGVVPKAGSKPSFLEKVFGPLQTPLAGVNAVVHNITTDNPDIDPLKEMGKAFRGEDYINGADLFEDWGWKPTTGAGKFAKGIAGFAWDIAADPLTYASFGLSKVSKLAAVEKAAQLADKTLDAAQLQKYGVTLLDDAAKRVADLSSPQKLELWRGVVREVAEELGDKGGVKFFGKSLVPGRLTGQSLMPKAVRTSKVGMALGSAFDNTYRIRNAADPFTAAVFSEYTRTFFNTVNKGVYEGVEQAKQLARQLPKGSHDFVGIALEASLDDASRARIGELVKGIKAGEWTDDILRSAQDELSELVSRPVDWDAFGIHLKALNNKLSDTEVERAIAAMQDFGAQMKGLRGKEIAAGLNVADRGSTYFPLVAGTPSKDVLSKLNVESLPDAFVPAGYRGKKSPLSKADFLKGRKYDTLAEALVEDKALATYAPEVLAKRTAKSAAAVAGEDFKSKIVSAFGKPLKEVGEEVSERSVIEVGGIKYAVDPLIKREIDNLMAPLLNDEAAKGVLDGINKLTSMWRKYATVMNPGFAPRNAISNFYLAYTKNFANPLDWAWAAKVRGWMQTGAIDNHLDDAVPGMKVTLREFLDEARSRGALRGGQVFEVTSDRMAQGWRRNPIADFGTDVNEFAEEWGRLAVFVQAWKKHGSSNIAAKLVDATLYNYDPKALTNVERGLRTIIPFMTWTRRNLPEMLSVLVHDPSKLGAIGKLRENMADVSDPIDKSLLPQYMRDMIAIPLPFKDKSGNPIMLNPNFGFQDLNRIDQPLRDTIASINPLFKVPLEIAFNRDVYFQSDIQDYKGQLRKAPGYLQALDKVVGGQDWWEAMKSAGGAKTIDGQLKVDPRFTKTIDAIPFLANLGKALENDNPQTPWRRISWLGGVKLMPYQEEKFEKDAAYEQRTALADAIRKMRDEGVLK